MLGQGSGMAAYQAGLDPARVDDPGALNPANLQGLDWGQSLGGGGGAPMPQEPSFGAGQMPFTPAAETMGLDMDPATTAALREPQAAATSDDQAKENVMSGNRGMQQFLQQANAQQQAQATQGTQNNAFMQTGQAPSAQVDRQLPMMSSANAGYGAQQQQQGPINAGYGTSGYNTQNGGVSGGGIAQFGGGIYGGGSTVGGTYGGGVTDMGGVTGAGSYQTGGMAGMGGLTNSGGAYGGGYQSGQAFGGGIASTGGYTGGTAGSGGVTSMGGVTSQPTMQQGAVTQGATFSPGAVTNMGGTPPPVPMSSGWASNLNGGTYAGPANNVTPSNIARAVGAGGAVPPITVTQANDPFANATIPMPTPDTTYYPPVDNSLPPLPPVDATPAPPVAMNQYFRAPSSLQLSDEEEKTDIHNPSPDHVQSMLDQLHAHQYRYKDPSAPGAGPGTYVSPMAQELERSPLGRNFVAQGPDGHKMVNYGHALGTMLAGQAMLNERLNGVDQMLSQLRGKR
jgi:hypothetical protein